MIVGFRFSTGDLTFALASLAPLGAVAYGWWRWKTGLLPFPLWRRIAALVGTCLITLQAVLFFPFWLGVNSNTSTIAYRAYRLYPWFLLAVPCALAGKGLSRWVLAATAIWLFCAYHYLIFLIY